MKIDSYEDRMSADVCVSYKGLDIEVYVNIEDGDRYITAIDVNAEKLKEQFMKQVDLYELTEQYKKNGIETYHAMNADCVKVPKHKRKYVHSLTNTRYGKIREVT